MARKSNIELLRIVSMLLVLFLHANYPSLGSVTVSDIQSAPLPSFGRALAEQLCIIAVNVFVFISGWFGIKPSVKGFCSLMFQVLFYHTLISGIAFCCGLSVSLSTLLMPVRFGIPYWFVVSYLVMYIMTPVLNTFIEKASSKSLFAVVLLFYMMQTSTGFCAHFGGFHAGYSAISFIGLYLLARFIRLYSHKIILLSGLYNISLYILFSTIPVLLYFITKKDFDSISYASPFVIAATVFFFLSFNRLNFSSRLVNYMACSVFSVYLVHVHPFIWDFYRETMKKALEYLGAGEYLLFVVIASILFTILCVLIDKVRLRVWNYVSRKILPTFVERFESLFNKIHSAI